MKGEKTKQNEGMNVKVKGMKGVRYVSKGGTRARENKKESREKCHENSKKDKQEQRALSASFLLVCARTFGLGI